MSRSSAGPTPDLPLPPEHARRLADACALLGLVHQASVRPGREWDLLARELSRLRVLRLAVLVRDPGGWPDRWLVWAALPAGGAEWAELTPEHARRRVTTWLTFRRPEEWVASAAVLDAAEAAS